MEGQIGPLKGYVCGGGDPRRARYLCTMRRRGREQKQRATYCRLMERVRGEREGERMRE